MRIWPPQPSDALPPDSNDPSNGSPQDDSQQPRTLREKIVAALKEVYDPEIPVNVYDLGLIYKIVSDTQTGKVEVEMTLTTPNCPEAEAIPGRIRKQIELIPEVTSAEVEIVWDPPWDQSRMTEDARLILGLD